MKTILLSVFLLVSTSVQADQTCDDLYSLITDTKPQLDALYQTVMLKQHAYIGTTERLFPVRKAERKQDYENYARMYDRQSRSYNQQVQIYQKSCE